MSFGIVQVYGFEVTNFNYQLVSTKTFQQDPTVTINNVHFSYF